VPEGWDRPLGSGWDHDSVLATQVERWPAFLEQVRGTGPLARCAETAGGAPPDYATHNTVTSFGYALARAAGGRERLSLLDWGSGIGHYYVLARALLPGVDIEYHGRDLPRLAAHGRTLFPEARFYADASCLDRRYDFVLASASLHYDRAWADTLAGLARATGRYLFVTRLPVCFRAPSYVAIQRPHRHGYRTEYLGWVLNRGEVLDRAAACGLVLEREFLIDERPRIVRAPEACEYRGFLFHPAAAAGGPAIPGRPSA
jgi:putative methyltransferase (TIGR04325 family)